MSKKSQRRRTDRRRREEERRQQQQNQVITIVAGVLIVAVVGFIIWQISQSASNESVAEAVDGSCVSSDPDGTRPLAALDPLERNNFYSEYPEMTLDTSKDYEAVISVFGKGEMRLELFDDEAPLTVNNFIFLSEQGFYDCLLFHRVITDFMAQTGDPAGTGSGGPGYEFEDETENGLLFDRAGLLAMANRGPATNGSQFFITFTITDWLNGNHTVFGEIVEGQDILSNITIYEPGSPATPDVIQRIDIEETS